MSYVNKIFGYNSYKDYVEKTRTKKLNVDVNKFALDINGKKLGIELPSNYDELISNMEGIYKKQNFSDNDVFLSIIPLSNVFERMGGHFTSFSNGCTSYYAESIETVGENLAEVSPTYVLCVPRIFEKMYSKILLGLKSAPRIRQKIFWW